MNKIVLEVVCLIFTSRVILSEARPKRVARNEHWNYDYCNLQCNGTMHTMCKYPPGGGDACDNNLKVYLTKEEKMYIEDNLNGIRLLVATGKFGNLPKASNMMKLVWDQELSTIAKRWADQCTQPLHDSCRLTADEVETGQAVVIGRYPDHARGDEARMVRIKQNLVKWEAEANVFDPATLHSYDTSAENSTGNFTQIIWGTTDFVGCGYTEFQMRGYVTSRFVCNFKRRGNIPFSYIYRVGEPCTMCPARTVCSQSFKGMCWNGKFGNYAPQVDDSGGNRLNSPVVSLIVSCAVALLYR